MVALPSAHGTGRAGIDPGARKRLAARFGSGVEAWFGELPGVLAVVARWQLESGPAIPRERAGPLRAPDSRRTACRADGQPDRACRAFEAAAPGAGTRTGTRGAPGRFR